MQATAKRSWMPSGGIIALIIVATLLRHALKTWDGPLHLIAMVVVGALVGLNGWTWKLNRPRRIALACLLAFYVFIYWIWMGGMGIQMALINSFLIIVPMSEIVATGLELKAARIRS